MANTLLTIDMITREALVVLHQQANFIGNVNRDYDDSFAKEGAKIGSSLRVRLPNEYVIRTGATLNAQDTVEQQVTLPVKDQYGVDLNFTSADLTLSLDDFSQRIIQPAVSVLVSNVESAFYRDVYKEVYNVVDNDGNAITFKNCLQAKAQLTKNLANPSDRFCGLDPDHTVDLVDVLKGLFQDSGAIASQYREGMMGRTGGLDFLENTHFSDHTTGTAAKTTGYLVNGAAQSGATLTVDGGSTTFLIGDVITIAGVNRVHPETKLDTGILQQFVVTADSGTSATSLALSPSISATGGTQNVTAVPADNAAIVKVGAGAGELMSGSMAWHKDSFTFATADLVMPSGVDMASRQVLDGVSMRLVRAYDINNDKFPVRMDILPAWKATRPKTACRIHADG